MFWLFMPMALNNFSVLLLIAIVPTIEAICARVLLVPPANAEPPAMVIAAALNVRSLLFANGALKAVSPAVKITQRSC